MYILNLTYDLYLKDIRDTPRLSVEEEKEIGRKSFAGDTEALAALIESNLLLVVKIAHGFNHDHTSIMDLISTGNIGLVEAAKRYDPDNPNAARFSTYASFWIKKGIIGESKQGGDIRIPPNTQRLLSQVIANRNELRNALGYEPTELEIATNMGVSVKTVQRILGINVSTPSYNASISNTDENENERLNFIADDTIRLPCDQVETSDILKYVLDYLDKLSIKERTVIIRRFGLDDQPQNTLEELGEQFKLTRERVRQIQEKALSKLRHFIEGLDRVNV